jgi:hypothetical protein
MPVLNVFQQSVQIIHQESGKLWYEKSSKAAMEVRHQIKPQHKKDSAEPTFVTVANLSSRNNIRRHIVMSDNRNYILYVRIDSRERSPTRCITEGMKLGEDSVAGNMRKERTGET